MHHAKPIYPHSYDPILFISNFREHVFTQASTKPFKLARGARQLPRDVSGLYENIFLEVRDEQSSLASYLFGQIGYGAYSCNKMTDP